MVPADRAGWQRSPVRALHERVVAHFQDLARTVGAEVPHDHGVVGTDAVLGRVTDDPWLDELIHHPGVIRPLHCIRRGVSALTTSMHHGVVRALDAVPAVVAVHRPVAPDDRANGGAVSLQRADGGQRGVRARVAAVGDGVHHHA